MGFLQCLPDMVLALPDQERPRNSDTESGDPNQFRFESARAHTRWVARGAGGLINSREGVLMGFYSGGMVSRGDRHDTGLPSLPNSAVRRSLLGGFRRFPPGAGGRRLSNPVPHPPAHERGASIVAVVATSTSAASHYVGEHLTNLRLAMFLEQSASSAVTSKAGSVEADLEV